MHARRAVVTVPYVITSHMKPSWFYCCDAINCTAIAKRLVLLAWKTTCPSRSNTRPTADQHEDLGTKDDAIATKRLDGGGDKTVLGQHLHPSRRIALNG